MARCQLLPVGAFVVEIVVQVSATGSYAPPVLYLTLGPSPPQTITLLPVQIAVWESRAVGALVVDKVVQVLVVGS